MGVHIPAVPCSSKTIHEKFFERFCTEKGLIRGRITPETAEQLRSESEVDMAVDEPGRDRMTRKIDNLCSCRLADGCSDLRNSLSNDQDLPGPERFF